MSSSQAPLEKQMVQEKPVSFASRRANLLAGCVIALAALTVYWNSFSNSFVLDDTESILENPTIRSLWPIWGPLSPPQGTGLTVSGRPLVNFSLAVNYAIGGTAVRGYHVANLLIHVLAGLTLFGVVRRTLLQPKLRDRFGTAAWPLALAVAVLWMLHPLQTESVTYIIQRAESLVALFYLLTLYGFIRATESRTPGRWYAVSVGACLLGMATKEVMVSAPLMVLLYDRTFVAGTFREAWKRRRALYVGMACTWFVLGYLAGGGGGTKGFGTRMTWWQYAQTQCWAIMHYLWLSVWPHPLVFDYGTNLVKDVAEIVPNAAILAALLVGTAVGLRCGAPLGFLGAWFFMILAPSSSVVPVATQTVAEHRMYLPLAAVATVFVAGLYRWLGRLSFAVIVAMGIGLGVLTIRRNVDYTNKLTLWADTVKKRPGNERAHNNLGVALIDAGRTGEAKMQLEEALRLSPDYADAHYNLGTVFQELGQRQEAMKHYKQAVGLKPDFAKAYYHLGNILLEMNHASEAMTQYETALRVKPNYAEARYARGIVLAQMGRAEEAKAHFEEAIRLKPDFAEAYNNLGNVFLSRGQLPEAMKSYEEALRANPDYARAHYNLGRALVKAGRTPEAKQQFEEALRLKPDYTDARRNLVALQSAPAGKPMD